MSDGAMIFFSIIIVFLAALGVCFIGFHAWRFVSDHMEYRRCERELNLLEIKLGRLGARVARLELTMFPSEPYRG
jgi:hypothetical protein